MIVFTVRAAVRFLCAAALAVTLTGAPAAAGTTPRPAPPAASGAIRGPGIHRASLAPNGALGALSAAQATLAAQTCARHAAVAGWANNEAGGFLVTATAVCVAESGGQPTVYLCDTTGKDGYYPPVNCPGRYDRGLWQLDSQSQSRTSDACAFAAQCNANAAYVISARGTSFAPWAVYTSGVYAGYLGDAQAAVAALRSGTVASGVLGMCLARARFAVNAPVVTGTCGTGVWKQRWTVSGTAISSGGLCVAAASRAAQAQVILRRCNGLGWQQWTPFGTSQLRNALAGRCLRDPGGSLTPGTAVTVAPCVPYRARRWWLP